MKKQQTKTEKLVFVALISLIALNAFSWWYVWTLRQDVDRSSASVIENIIQLNKKHGLLETCYEHNIKPCTDEAAKAVQQ